MLLSNGLIAQSNTDYYQTIEAAETMIVEGDCSEATAEYEKAFTVLDKPFAKDIDNALKCATLNNQFEFSYHWAKQLILLGCDIKYFNEQTTLLPFLESNYWLRLTKEYPQLRLEFINTCNWTLRAKIEELYARDQFWRVKDPNYTVLKDSTFKEDDLIMEELLEIMVINDYPNEYNIGLFFRQDTIIDYSPIQMIVLHNYVDNPKHYKSGIDLTQQLQEQIKKYKFHPDAFAYLNDRSGAYRIGEGFEREGLIWKLNGKFYAEKKGAEWINNVDERRKKLGMDTLKNDRQKAVYQTTINARFNFFHERIISIIDLPQPMIDKYFEEIK